MIATEVDVAFYNPCTFGDMFCGEASRDMRWTSIVGIMVDTTNIGATVHFNSWHEYFVLIMLKAFMISGMGLRCWDV